MTRDMVGRPVDTFYQKEHHPIGDVMLEIRELQIAKNSPKISFSVRRGEILGMAGMVGAGRTEIVRAITGADRRWGGEILVNGKNVEIRNPAESIEHG